MLKFSKPIGLVIGICSILLLANCSGEERIEPTKDSNNQDFSTGIFEPSSTEKKPAETQQHNHKMHQVEVVEILGTQKYTYLKVKESGKEYWIATLKGNYDVGDWYAYTGGLLKTNFKSVEHNRVFEELYLVSQITPVGTKKEIKTVKPKRSSNTNETTVSSNRPEDAIELASLINNPEKYADKTVKVFGKVVKVNPNIMDRNWLHIQDGTANDYDFVITSSKVVPVGHSITFEGVIRVNKDFGAGYKYNILMENAQPLQ